MLGRDFAIVVYFFSPILPSEKLPSVTELSNGYFILQSTKCFNNNPGKVV